MYTQFKNYLQLTKPSIMLLVVLTGTAGLVIQGDLNHSLLDFTLVLIGLFMTGGAANAFNQYFERKVDARMKRTSKRRPLPSGRIKPLSALIFACTMAFVGTAIFLVRFNPLSAMLAAGTIVFYSLFYTLYLKPSTVQNIVIGGASGAMPPVIAWVAAGGSIMSPIPWILFGVIFLWTPPHFWALALYLKDDYKNIDYPMMPIVGGEKKTLVLMLFYSILTVLVSLFLVFHQYYVYTVFALILGAILVYKSFISLVNPSRKSEFGLFKYSILYLLLLFSVLIFEGVVLK